MKVYENIKFLCKQEGIKVGDLEKECDRQRGYFSRHKDAPEEIPLGVLLKASEILGVELTWLMYTPMEENYRRRELREQLERLSWELAELEKESE